MRTRYVFGALALLTLAACGGSNSDVTVTGTDKDSLATSPSGAATLSLMDLEDIRPDNAYLAVTPQSSDVVKAKDTASCRTFTLTTDATNRVLTVAYNGCKSANGWAMSGTVVFTSPLTSIGSYTAAFNLTSQDSTGTKSWTYTGTKNIAINFTDKTATITASSPLTVAYTNSADATKNKTYHYTPNLTADWSVTGQYKLTGSFTFQPVGGTAIVAAVSTATPLIWTTSCCYPASGTLTLTAGNALVTAVFGPDCGALTLNGASLPLTCD